MCTYSMIIDKFGVDFQPWIGQKPWTAPNAPLDNPQALKDLIAEFKAAQEAAKVVDAALGDPDCEDPEKMALVARVAELEALLNQKTEGTYFLKDGEWYLHASGAYSSSRSSAKIFSTREDAEEFSLTLDPKPRVVRLRKKS